MILTDREIQLAIYSGQIEITPKSDDDAYSATSLDLTLSEPGEVWNVLAGQPIRPGTRGYSYSQLASRKTQIASLHNHTMRQNAFVLAWARETISLPITSRFAARV
ncbi:MAG: hypothetical protein ACREE1_19910 [Stellaceae bacterium]